MCMRHSPLVYNRVPTTIDLLQLFCQSGGRSRHDPATGSVKRGDRGRPLSITTITYYHEVGPGLLR